MFIFAILELQAWQIVSLSASYISMDIFFLTLRQGPLNFLGKACTLSLVQIGLELKMVPPYLSFLSSWFSDLCHTTQLSPTCSRSSRTINAEVSNMTLDIGEQMLTKAHSSPGEVLME